MDAALKAKSEKSLDIKMNYPEGIFTRREYMQLQHSKGATVKEETKYRCTFNRTKFNNMTNYAEQMAYEAKCAEVVTCYNLYFVDRGFIEITKTEFDYFNSLPSIKGTNISTDKTEVVFYMEVNADDTTWVTPLAYFPKEGTCYAHIGQHSECSPEYVANLKRATPEQYADLKAELESIGYNLEIID